jgi:hypothetical protein
MISDVLLQVSIGARLYAHQNYSIKKTASVGKKGYFFRLMADGRKEILPPTVLRHLSAGINFISFRKLLLRRLFWEEVFFLQIFRHSVAGYLAVLDFKRPQSLVLGIGDYRLF